MRHTNQPGAAARRRALIALFISVLGGLIVGAGIGITAQAILPDSILTDVLAYLLALVAGAGVASIATRGL